VEHCLYDLLKNAQSHHWWYLGKKKIMKIMIEQHISPSKKMKIADVGCGFGGNIDLLKGYGDVTGLETFKKAQRYIQEKWGDSVKVINASVPDEIAYRFDLIVMADVLEHILDDRGATHWIHRNLNSKGYALITVPAHQQLWTRMDDLNHHHRRYSKKTLLQLFVDKFEIVRFTYYNFSLLPAKLAHVVFDRLHRTFAPRRKKNINNDTPSNLTNPISKYFLYPETPTKPVNEILKTITCAESKLFELGISFPTGVNIALLARKRI
jgi:SAM-dependent methyltransferase